MDGEIFFDINRIDPLLHELIILGVEEVTFSGGEPLVYPFIEEVISECSKLGLQTTIYSTGINSMGINKINYRFIESLKYTGLNKIIFSLYSDKEKVHEQITRVRYSLKSTLHAVEVSLACNLEVEFHFIPLRPNFRSISGIIALARDYGIKKVSILRFVPHGRGILLKNIYSLNRVENLELRNIILKLREEESVSIRLGSPYNILLLEEDVYCSAGIDRLIINPQGSIFPCDAFKNIFPNHIGVPDNYNSIMDDSLIEVWNKSNYLNKIRTFLAKEFNEPCYSCKYLERCKSGCLAQKVIKNNSLKVDIDPNCLVYGV
jgi:radical SAM protein with 4Fe4S-binding SPASM domain